MIAKHKRIVSLDTINSVRVEKCEVCGGYAKYFPHEVHHVITKGAGGDDIKENLICLCKKCHTDVHGGKIEQADCFKIIAKRENKAMKTILKLNRRFFD